MPKVDLHRSTIVAYNCQHLLVLNLHTQKTETFWFSILLDAGVSIANVEPDLRGGLANFKQTHRMFAHFSFHLWHFVYCSGKGKCLIKKLSSIIYYCVMGVYWIVLFKITYCTSSLDSFIYALIFVIWVLDGHFNSFG